jgi:hypothetical protein
MWFNGFIVIIDMALGALDEPLLNRQRDALVLGAFREDVCCVPGTRWVFQSPSLAHFSRRRVPGGFIPLLWPDAAQRTRKFFNRALDESARGRQTAAFVQLGRAVHPLIDMACPVHAQGVAHTTDPFEWCVEAMGEELRRLPVSCASARSVEGLVRGMAQFAQTFAADKTNNPWGRMLRRVGVRQPLHMKQARAQARLLIPRAAECTAALLQTFVERAEPLTVEGSPPVEHLEMTAGGVRTWLAQLDMFCCRHGGARHYQELMALTARWRAQLAHRGAQCVPS